MNDTRFEDFLDDSSEEGGVSTMSEVLDRAEARGDRRRMEEDARGMYEEGIQLDVIARIQKTTVDVIKEILGLQSI